MLTQEVIKYAERSVLAWLATVDGLGYPNVSPKELFAVVDGRDFVIANIASPTTVRNLLGNPRACLSFIDVLVQKGFKVTGTAEVIAPDHEDFLRWAKPLLDLVQGKFYLHSVIVLHPQTIQPIIAPSYRFYPLETTEQSQYLSALKAYMEVPKPEDGT